MPKVNKTKYAILGMLLFEPMTGYDIKKYIERGVGHFWNENYGHLYPVLKKLEEEGLIVMEIEKNDGRPDRHVYSITESGREEMQEWLLLPPEKCNVRNEFLFKLYFGGMIPLEVNINRIKSQRKKSEEYIRVLREYEASNRKRDFRTLAFAQMTNYRGIYDAEATIKWCDKCLELLEKLKNGDTDWSQPDDETDL